MKNRLTGPSGILPHVLIVFHAFEGRYADSPRALHAALTASRAGHEHVWLSDPAHEAGFPEGVRHVTWGTPEGREALEAADLLVANTHTDTAWDKREGARYLQTWHGTPLKRIHRDVLWAPAGRLDRLDRDVARWDVLLSPNRASTPHLRGAFRFEGDVLESGYPRNDVLSWPDRDEARARVRERLGIPEGTRAVLYAPTWRDDEVFERDGASFGLRLDPARLADELGEGTVLLLRLHYMLTGRLGELDHPRVQDVSFWPEVADLYLAADVLVTDYSSVMFDFGVLDRPIVLYAYDLERYEAEVRGFYLDLEAERPGPLVRTEDDLLDVLRDPASGRDDARLARFRERFCHLEDGRASERVLEHLGLGAAAA